MKTTSIYACWLYGLIIGVKQSFLQIYSAFGNEISNFKSCRLWFFTYFLFTTYFWKKNVLNSVLLELLFP